MSGASARYSGDISSWAWTQYGQPAKSYAFTYDGAHRLTAGQFYNNGSSTNALSEKAISYDKAGNITALSRYNNSGAATSLAYNYTGNRRNNYSYDVNGNVTSDATKNKKRKGGDSSKGIVLVLLALFSVPLVPLIFVWDKWDTRDMILRATLFPINERDGGPPNGGALSYF